MDRLIQVHQEISAHLSKRSSEDQAYEVCLPYDCLDMNLRSFAECARTQCCHVGSRARRGIGPIGRYDGLFVRSRRITNTD